jgi:hypothetical protein
MQPGKPPDEDTNEHTCFFFRLAIHRKLSAVCSSLNEHSLSVSLDRIDGMDAASKRNRSDGCTD